MSTHNDDFWGATGDWSDATPRRTPSVTPHDVPRTRPIGVIRRGWTQMLSGGANATREHGITRPIVRPTVFDDFDDFDGAEAPASSGGERTDRDRSADHRPMAGAAPLIVPTDEPSNELTRELARSFQFADDADRFAPAGHPIPEAADADWASWDDEFEPVSRTAALDPLLGKLGALAVVAALLVPLLLSLSSHPGDTLAESATALAAVPEDTAADVAAATAGELAPPAASLEAAGESPDGSTLQAPAEQTQVASAATDASVAATPQTTATAPDTAAASSASANDAAGNAALGSDQTAAAAQPAVADTPAERVCAIDYEVVAGDYWIRIADGAGVALAELFEANGASASTPLYPGAAICLPAGSTTPPPPAPAPATTAPATTTPATTAPATTTPPTTAPTTTAPATTTTTTVPAGPRDVKQIIRDVWPDDLEERALEIAWRESRYVPTAKNYCCYGIFQIYWNVHRGWLDDIGITDDQQLYDPETNARAAYALYQRAGGWGPWSL